MIRLKLCRKPRRGKNSAVVIASDGVHLLDQINMVNKNPTYLMGNVLTYHKSAGVTNIPVDHIKQLEALGEGAFGQVYKGKLFVKHTL